MLVNHRYSIRGAKFLPNCEEYIQLLTKNVGEKIKYKIEEDEEYNSITFYRNENAKIDLTFFNDTKHISLNPNHSFKDRYLYWMCQYTLCKILDAKSSHKYEKLINKK